MAYGEIDQLAINTIRLLAVSSISHFHAIAGTPPSLAPRHAVAAAVVSQLWHRGQASICAVSVDKMMPGESKC